ncbi:MAG: thiamine-phosphate kinase, partial [Helicobacter sp.]|nr:thiamine-phosphate kinase [Helicobacter sp.]
KKILTRSGVKKGDIVGFITPDSALVGIKTQKFGNNFKNLKIALRFYKNARIPQSTRFNKPLLYPQMLFCLNKIAKSGMDISDGIFLELTRLSALNRVGFKFIKKLGFWLYSPEEYQMLYVIDKRNLKKMQNSTKRFRHRFIPFAIAVRGKYKSKHKNWHC